MNGLHGTAHVPARDAAAALRWDLGGTSVAPRGEPGPLRAVDGAFPFEPMATETKKVGDARRRFVVAETRETLSTSGQWLNEIHPTSEGFGLIADRVFAT